jgi:hypothetical protein
MHYLLSIYFSNYPLNVSSRLTAHHQEVLLCIYSNWYTSRVYVNWLLAGSEWNSQFIFKLKVNSASYWFLLHGYITMYSQQNIKQGAINVASSPDILDNGHHLRPKAT